MVGHIIFKLSKLITGISAIGFGLYGIGIENPLMNLMSSCGQWWFILLIISGSISVGSLIWWTFIEKGYECGTKYKKK